MADRSNRSARQDWQTYQADKIPSKSKITQLEDFLERFPALLPSGRRRTLLDLGCGAGEISSLIYGQGYEVVGVDINDKAIERAQGLEPAGHPNQALHFLQTDIANANPPALPLTPFDLVVCQLVISVVGTPADRLRLLSNAYSWLRPGGHLYLSASGVSDDVNSNYAKLYADDFALTGERYSYFSRDSDGNILYQTHHFTRSSLQTLLTTAGFSDINILTEKEQSSRRPDQAAYFHYAVAHKG